MLEFRIKKNREMSYYSTIRSLYNHARRHGLYLHVRIKRGGGAGGPDPLKKSQNIWFLSNSGPDPLTNHTAVSQHSMLGHHQHTSEMPFKWRFAGGPMVFAYSGIWIFPPLIIKKNVVKVGPPLTKFSGSEHDLR